jgi:CDGSH-type Zn-finger protein/ferredoxin
MDAEITPTPDGPLHAQRIKALKNVQGETIDTGDSIYLCRCGASKNKPYCDGSHTAAGFSDRRQRSKPAPAAEVAGKEITVVDDVSLCAHAGECVGRAPKTFFTPSPAGRVSHPDATPLAELIAAIRHCPSGALLFKQHGKLVHAYATNTEVRVEQDGPLHVQRAKLAGKARPATEDHYTLCRCGASLNKPFCDGMHAKVKFRDGSGY